MKRTIEKILGYKPFSEYDILKLEGLGLYNGTGTNEINFDLLIIQVLDLLEQARIFDKNKKYILRQDIIQLVIRHDIETHFKCGFRRSNRRLAIGIYKLLHHFPIKYKIGVALTVYIAVSSKTARKNYYS